MSNKIDMEKFIKRIEEKGLLTQFIKIIFNYDYLEDYNYIFRIRSNNQEIIIDIYDNVSINRFNRYIFSFIPIDKMIMYDKDKATYITKIDITKVYDNNDYLLKFSYLFKIDSSMRREYASSFLPNEIVSVLK